MECMGAQTRPQFILSSNRVLGNSIRTHVKFKGKIPSTGGSEESLVRLGQEKHKVIAASVTLGVDSKP